MKIDIIFLVLFPAQAVVTDLAASVCHETGHTVTLTFTMSKIMHKKLAAGEM